MGLFFRMRPTRPLTPQGAAIALPKSEETARLPVSRMRERLDRLFDHSVVERPSPRRNRELVPAY
jgi:hypothetical protein